jgi:hypothetical protein
LISRLGQHTGQQLKTKRKAMTYNILSKKRRLGNTNPTKNNNNTNPKEKQR